MRIFSLLSVLLITAPNALLAQSILPKDWNSKQAGNRVMDRLVKVTAPQVKGAHDGHFVIVNDRAFVVAEVSDLRPGEAPSWPEVYVSLSIVRLSDLKVEKILLVARGEQQFANETLPVGACFVPRVIQLNAKTIRCFFASEQPGKRQSQVWMRDFDLEKMQFENRIERLRIQTTAGTFDFQPHPFFEDAVRAGFKHPEKDYGAYLFDTFKKFGGRTYVAINNYPGAQNALAVMNAEFDTCEVVGHYNRPFDARLTESAVNQLPDGTWMAICRQESGSRNYLFTTSKDGRAWSAATERPFVPNGTSSKPTFDFFDDLYYLGWQEKTRIDGVSRSVFNVDVSKDGKTWERKYRFETVKSFQYPTFVQHADQIWLCVTQGDSSSSRKERIMFGKLQD